MFFYRVNNVLRTCYEPVSNDYRPIAAHVCPDSSRCDICLDWYERVARVLRAGCVRARAAPLPAAQSSSALTSATMSPSAAAAGAAAARATTRARRHGASNNCTAQLSGTRKMGRAPRTGTVAGARFSWTVPVAAQCGTARNHGTNLPASP